MALVYVTLVPTVIRITLASGRFEPAPGTSGWAWGSCLDPITHYGTFKYWSGGSYSSSENLGALGVGNYTCIRWAGTPGNITAYASAYSGASSARVRSDPVGLCGVNGISMFMAESSGAIKGSYNQFLQFDFGTAIAALQAAYDPNVYSIGHVETLGAINVFNIRQIDFENGGNLSLNEWFNDAYKNGGDTLLSLEPKANAIHTKATLYNKIINFTTHTVQCGGVWPLPEYPTWAVAGVSELSAVQMPQDCTLPDANVVSQSFSFGVWLDDELTTYSEGSGSAPEIPWTETTDTSAIIPPTNPGLVTINRGGLHNSGTTNSRGVPDDVEIHEYIYKPANIDISDSPGTVIGEGVIIKDDTGWFNGVETSIGMQIDSISLSLLEQDTMTFTQTDKFDATPWFEINDIVFGSVYGTIVFRGRITAVSPEVSDKNQVIKFTAMGDRIVLSSLPWIFKYVDDDGASISTLIGYICDYTQSRFISSYDASSITDDLNVYLPSIELGPTTVAEGLDQFLDVLGRFSYHIDTARRLTVFDLKNLTLKEIKVPTEGDVVSANTKLLSANFSMDISTCYTRCILIGDTIKKEHRGNVGFNTWSTYRGYQQRGYLTFSTGTQISGTPSAYVYDKDGNKQSVSVLSTNYDKGIIYLSYPSSVTEGGNRPCPDLSGSIVVIWITEGLNLFYDTGYTGDAYTTYGLQKTKVIENANFKCYDYPSQGETRNDYGAMKRYADATIDRSSSAIWQGTVVLDGLDYTWTIGAAAYFSNTRSEWGIAADTQMVVTSVTFNISELTTTLQLTTKCYLNTGASDSTYLIDQKAKLKEEKIRLKTERADKLTGRFRLY